jgi:hypothetical protein
MNKNKEEILALDEKNFNQHINELKKLFGMDVSAPDCLALKWIKCGEIPYRKQPFGNYYTDKITERFLVSDPEGNPRFFLRTSQDNGFVLFIECLSPVSKKKDDDKAFIKFSIKKERLTCQHLAELREVIEHFFSNICVPQASFFDIQKLKRNVEDLVKERNLVIRKQVA